MSGLTLRLKVRLRERLDASSLLPERLAGLAPSVLTALPLRLGNREVPLGDLFDASPGSDPDTLMLRASSTCLTGIGAGMTRGRIDVRGSVGADLGSGMRGGILHVSGDAGAGAGAGMHDGWIDIGGDAGDFLGGGLPGAMEGMAGGRIHVRGNAGDRVGDRQRRGLIVIEGDAGDYCGSRMRAGTIIVLGEAGRHVGAGMRRGTIVLRRRPKLIGATFNSCGVLKMEMLRLLFRSLRREHRRFSVLEQLGPRAERLVGDIALGGKGELLLLAGPE